MKSPKRNSYFVANVFLWGVFGVLLTVSCVHSGVIHEKDLDTLLLRSGVEFPNANQQSSSSVPKEIQDLVSAAQSVPLSSIPKRLQPIIQYALERPYPGNGNITFKSRANNDKIKKTIVYLVTSRLHQRGNNDETQIQIQENINENPEQPQQQQQDQQQTQQQPQQQYGAPSDSSSFRQQNANVIRTVLKEVPQYKSTSKSILQPKQDYNAPQTSAAQRQQNYNSAGGRIVSSNQQPKYEASALGGVLTIRPRPTPPSPDFEIIRTISSDADTLLAPKQNLRSAYRAALRYPHQFSSQAASHPQPQYSPAHFSSQAESHSQPQYSPAQFSSQAESHPQPQYSSAPVVNLVPSAAQTYQEDVDEGLSVLGGAEGLSALVAKIEGLGDNPQPNQLEFSQDVIQSSPEAIVPVAPVPVAVVDTNVPHVTVVETNSNIPHDLHSQQNDYITYLNPPLVLDENSKPLEDVTAGIHAAAAAAASVPIRKINIFFKNVLRSFRRNISNLRNLRPTVTYDNNPWPNYISATNFNQIASPKQVQHIQQPTLVSTTTYTSSQPVEQKGTHVNVFPSVSFSAQGIQNH